jgi:hypothetical protein
VFIGVSSRSVSGFSTPEDPQYIRLRLCTFDPALAARSYLERHPTDPFLDSERRHPVTLPEHPERGVNPVE